MAFQFRIGRRGGCDTAVEDELSSFKILSMEGAGVGGQGVNF